MVDYGKLSTIDARLLQQAFAPLLVPLYELAQASVNGYAKLENLRSQIDEHSEHRSKLEEISTGFSFSYISLMTLWTTFDQTARQVMYIAEQEYPRNRLLVPELGSVYDPNFDHPLTELSEDLKDAITEFDQALVSARLELEDLPNRFGNRFLESEEFKQCLSIFDGYDEFEVAATEFATNLALLNDLLGDENVVESTDTPVQNIDQSPARLLAELGVDLAPLEFLMEQVIDNRFYEAGELARAREVVKQQDTEDIHPFAFLKIQNGYRTCIPQSVNKSEFMDLGNSFSERVNWVLTRTGLFNEFDLKEMEFNIEISDNLRLLVRDSEGEIGFTLREVYDDAARPLMESKLLIGGGLSLSDIQILALRSAARLSDSSVRVLPAPRVNEISPDPQPPKFGEATISAPEPEPERSITRIRFPRS